RTGIDLPHEESGLMPDPEWKQRVSGQPWFPGETVSVAIGQGPVLITPAQMARLMQIVALGEVPPAPRVRLPEAPGEGPVAALEPLSGTRSESLRMVRAALRDVVNGGGTGGRARLDDVEVCGKTGTVQVVAHSAGVDSAKLAKEVRDHSWFAGWAPCGEPRVAFAVFVEHGGHGGDSAAPIAKRVLEVYFGKVKEGKGVQIAQGQRSAAP
ncbi:MAG: hypothetical protein L0Z62_25345, partial [Gemmataceae bacterium]|nr:hypothetical protein [Gemmataceae bacterium]